MGCYFLGGKSRSVGSCLGQPLLVNESLNLSFLPGGGLLFPPDRCSHWGVPGNGLFSLKAISSCLSMLMEALWMMGRVGAPEILSVLVCVGENVMKKTKQDLLLTQKSSP